MLIGGSIGPYHVLAKLGEGGMGEVYRARDEKLARDVAIKILPRSTHLDADRLRRFEREARLLASLGHANIATVHGLEDLDGTPALVMELVEGPTLAERLARGALPLREALAIARQVALALDAAHAKGIVHRDLKPANIAMTRDGEVKVLDFGLAKVFDPSGAADAVTATADVTHEGAVLGTAAYMSPEQIRGAVIDRRTDLWAFGCVLYESLTGRHPFAATTAGETWARALHEDPDFGVLPDGTPAGIRFLLRRCLQKEPGQRFRDAGDAAMQIEEAWQEPIPVPRGAPAVPPGGRTPHAFAWARTWAPALAVIAALLAVGAGLLVWRPAVEHSPIAGDQRLITDFAGNHTSPTFSPDGSMMAFASDASGTSQIWVQSITGGAPVQITQGESPAFAPSWSPLNDRIVFYRTEPGAPPAIWSIDPLGTTQPRRIIDAGLSPAFASDGRSIVYTGIDAIWLANADGTDRRPVAGTEGRPTFDLVSVQPALSPDGRHVAYFGNLGGSPLGDIWVVPSAGGEPRRVTFEEARVASPVWTADGRFIIYQSSRGGTPNLWSVPFEGGDPRPVTVGAGEHGAPVVSRDGRALLYTNRRVQWELVRSDPAIGSHDVLLQSRNAIYLPEVSPEGRRIAYFSELATGVHLFTIGSDGTGARQLTFGDGHFNIRPTWAGDGRSLLFYQDRPTGSLRRQPLDGGPSSEVFADFRDTTHTAARESPQGDAIVFTRVEEPGSGRATRTLVWDIATGTETVLELPAMGGFTWSSGGDEILGYRPGGDNEIAICPAIGGPCEVPAEDGVPVRGAYPRWSFDGSRIYFLRSLGTDPVTSELWVMERDGSNPHKVLELGPQESTADRFDVLPDGRIIWNRYHRGDDEIWIATLGG